MEMSVTKQKARERRAKLLEKFESINPKWGAIQALAVENKVSHCRIWQLLRKAREERTIKE